MTAVTLHPGSLQSEMLNDCGTCAVAHGTAMTAMTADTSARMECLFHMAASPSSRERIEREHRLFVGCRTARSPARRQSGLLQDLPGVEQRAHDRIDAGLQRGTQAGPCSSNRRPSAARSMSDGAATPPANPQAPSLKKLPRTRPRS